MQNVTALTVVYNTPELLINSVGSFKKFYPDIPLLIMNNSDKDHACSSVVSEYVERYNNVRAFNFRTNQGHGTAVDMGIKNIDTDVIYYFDSDINMKVGGAIEGMMELMNDEVYGVGNVIDVDTGGRNIRHDYTGERVKFLHLVVGLLNRNMYYKFHPFTRYGLPIFKALLEIHKSGNVDKMIKYFPIFNYVKHLSGGTRSKHGDCEKIVEEEVSTDGHWSG